MFEEVKKLTPTGHIQRPAYSTIAEWVDIAWKNVDPILIWKSFKCCSISNACNSSEDHLIFDYDQLIINNKPQNTNYVFENEEEEANSINNSKDSSMNQMLNDKTQFDNDSDNSEENEIDYYKKESLEYSNSWD